MYNLKEQHSSNKLIIKHAAKLFPYKTKCENLSSCVAENDCLRDCQRIVQVTQCIEFPFFAIHRNEKLFNSFQRQFITKEMLMMCK